MGIRVEHSCIEPLVRAFCISFQMGCGRTIDKNQAKYHDNLYSAPGTNSRLDVNIENANDLIDHLKSIGFEDITFVIKPAYSDSKHINWIYTKATK